MNLFDSSTPYSLFPAPSVPPAPRKSTEPQKSNLKTNQKSANNSTAVFYPSTPVSAATTECYQKLNSNFPPASNCSSSATNLSLSSSTTNSLANFNMSTIFPEMNDKVDATGASNGSRLHHMGQQQQQLPATTAVAATATPQQQQQQQQHDTTTGTDASAR
ncbi:hypothetical protein LSTR_LSTR012588 [Laodelphax striatellus]|uniref:Uncharacterized protein n=1 Tax=Laodelphax striatellus TaxID=195883 RepID=A0A482X9G8_LAOST|nr:hypothetical protein LSTR_LSTR012588 [Laodelphax striatellus]